MILPPPYPTPPERPIARHRRLVFAVYTYTANHKQQYDRQVPPEHDVLVLVADPETETVNVFPGSTAESSPGFRLRRKNDR